MYASKIILCTSLFWANICCAEPCGPEIIQKLTKYTATQPADTEFSACKLMPNKPQYMLVALAQFRPDPTSSDPTYVGHYDINVMVVDTTYYKPVNKLTKAKVIPVDAVALTDLDIDTARYNLNNSQRAFGVRITLSGSSRVNPYSQTFLNLYIESGAALQEILSDFEVALSGGEWDGNCEGEFFSAASTLSIKKPEATGFSDILVKTEHIDTVNSLVQDECSYQDKAKEITRSQLKYAGGSYKLITEKSR